jgi:hypothetical protein
MHGAIMCIWSAGEARSIKSNQDLDAFELDSNEGQS